MSDARALLFGRGIVLGDGAYLEHAAQAPHAVEEWLRTLVARFTSGTAKRDGNFVRQINALEEKIRALDDDGLRTAMSLVTEQMQTSGFRDDLLARAFAIVREASRRSLGMRHHDVQLLAGHALLRGPYRRNGHW